MIPPTQSFVSFRCARSLFALASKSVLEMFSLPEVTRLESPHPAMLGGINLRGSIIPVFDLNVCFGHPPAPFQLSDRVIVVANDAAPFGFVVNEVLDVLPIAQDDIGLAPLSDLAGHPDSSPVLGVAKVGDDIMTVLDPAKLIRAAIHRLNGAATGGDEPTLHTHIPSSLPEIQHPDHVAFNDRARALRHTTVQEESNDVQQVVVVRLSDEFFGIETKAIQEFSRIENITPIPNCPEHIVGNINLRGHILTVIDLRGPLDMSPGKVTHLSQIVVVSVDDLRVGVAVDEVLDITLLRPIDIWPLPTSVRSAIEKHAKGAANYAGRAMTVLNITEILTSPHLLVNDPLA